MIRYFGFGLEIINQQRLRVNEKFGNASQKNSEYFFLSFPRASFYFSKFLTSLYLVKYKLVSDKKTHSSQLRYLSCRKSLRIDFSHFLKCFRFKLKTIRSPEKIVSEAVVRIKKKKKRHSFFVRYLSICHISREHETIVFSYFIFLFYLRHECLYDNLAGAAVLRTVSE